MMHVPMFFYSWIKRQVLYEDTIDEEETWSYINSAEKQLQEVGDCDQASSTSPASDVSSSFSQQWERYQPKIYKIEDEAIGSIPIIPFHSIDINLEHTENSEDEDEEYDESVEITEVLPLKKLELSDKPALAELLARALQSQNEEIEEVIFDDDDDLSSFFVSAPGVVPAPRVHIPTEIHCHMPSEIQNHDDDMMDPVEHMLHGTITISSLVCESDQLYSFLLQEKMSTRDDEQAAALIRKHPTTAEVKYKCLVPETSRPFYPLAYLAARNAFYAVQAAYEAFPEAIGQEDYQYLGLPLHYACHYQVDLRIIEFLLQKFPDGARYTNHRHQTALHLVCQQRAIRYDVVELLLEHYPTAAQLADSNGYTPFHLACQRNASVDILRLLNELSPTAVRAATRDWQKPLHIAVQHGAGLDVIEWLLQADPSAAKATTESFNSVLHCALEGNSSLPVLRRLIQAHPQLLMWTNSNDETPLDVAIYTGASEQVLELFQT